MTMGAVTLNRSLGTEDQAPSTQLGKEEKGGFFDGKVAALEAGLTMNATS